MPTTQTAAGRAFTYQYSLGRTSVSGEGFVRPLGVARAGDTLYVPNWGERLNPCARVTKCTLNHEWILDIGGPGTGDGQFLCPGGIALDNEENVYVTDQASQKIVVFDKDGKFLGKWGESGAKEGQLNKPSGMAFDKDQNLIVVDTHNNRVQKFSKDGGFLATWGVGGSDDGQLSLPWGVSIDGHGDIYVADWGNDRVQKFSSDGQYLATFGKPGKGKGELNHPSGVAIDRDGDVYVTDWGNHRVHVYEPDGGYLATFIGDAMELSPWAQMFIDANPDYARAMARADLEPTWRLLRPGAITVGDDYRIIIVETQHDRLQIYLKDLEYEDPQFNL